MVFDAVIKEKVEFSFRRVACFTGTSSTSPIIDSQSRRRGKLQLRLIGCTLQAKVRQKNESAKEKGNYFDEMRLKVEQFEFYSILICLFNYYL